MNLLIIILLIVSVVCFALATFNVPVKINLIAAGLLAWVLTVLIPLIK